ncbi:MAG: hypothetical protein PVH88_08840 [Ignavibacteria bacterium]|jgi:hypothetical protein
MNKQTIEKFLKSNQLDDRFYLDIYNNEICIAENAMDFSIHIDINTIKNIGLNYKYIFFETQFGKFEFLRKDNMDILKKAFGNQK